MGRRGGDRGTEQSARRRPTLQSVPARPTGGMACRGRRRERRWHHAVEAIVSRVAHVGWRSSPRSRRQRSESVLRVPVAYETEGATRRVRRGALRATVRASLAAGVGRNWTARAPGSRGQGHPCAAPSAQCSARARTDAEESSGWLGREAWIGRPDEVPAIGRGLARAVRAGTRFCRPAVSSADSPDRAIQKGACGAGRHQLLPDVETAIDRGVAYLVCSPRERMHDIVHRVRSQQRGHASSAGYGIPMSLACSWLMMVAASSGSRSPSSTCSATASSTSTM